MKEYSVLTFNFGGYEILHEIPDDAINPNIDYVYVTDDTSIKSDTWRIVYSNPKGSVFDKCLQIRLYPFIHLHNNVVMCIDGSMGIVNDVMPLFEEFDKGNYDASVMIHPGRYTMLDEYEAWTFIRNYPIEQAHKCLGFMQNTLHYDVSKYKGLYQANFKIQRNDAFNRAWNEETYDICRYLATEPDTVERVDQTISSAILNMNYSHKKIMPVSNLITNGKFFNWYQHGTNNPMYCNIIPQQYLFDKEIRPIDFDL